MIFLEETSKRSVIKNFNRFDQNLEKVDRQFSNFGKNGVALLYGVYRFSNFDTLLDHRLG